MKGSLKMNISDVCGVMEYFDDYETWIGLIIPHIEKWVSLYHTNFTFNLNKWLDNLVMDAKTQHIIEDDLDAIKFREFGFFMFSMFASECGDWGTSPSGAWIYKQDLAKQYINEMKGALNNG
jgi:hypothetical protein